MDGLDGDCIRVAVNPGGDTGERLGDGLVLEAPAWATMAQALFLGGFFPGRALCSGLGRCGLCRARYLGQAPAALARERRKLGDELVRAGWRLTCQHPAEPALLLVPATAYGAAMPLSDPSGPSGTSRPVRPGLVLAVDVGTTSLEWAARQDGLEIARGRDVNPQMGAGAEIVSRLAFAARDKGYLRQLMLDYLRRVAARLPGRPESLCLAGNPAMMYILLGRDLGGLTRAPYHLDYPAGEPVELAGDLPRAVISPLLGPFVGGDASAGLIHQSLARGASDYPFVLADLGTNGEFILALTNDSFLAASAPLGPALEGSGLSHGVLAGTGCAVGFEAGPTGLAPILYEGHGVWDGRISGTGYLSLIAALKRFGVILRDGRFAWVAGAGVSAALAGRLGASLLEDAPEAGLRLTGSPSGETILWASDVEEVLKVKAACNTVFSRLFRSAALEPFQLKHLDLAGALGEHVSAVDLEELGFIPAGLGRIITRAGNASLAGAMDLLCHDGALEAAGRLGEQTVVLDLANDPDFETDYLTRMVFEYVP